MWIIRSIEQRKATIKKVIESILKFQMNFLKEENTQPFIEEVADDIDMHESTISRLQMKICTDTRGLFELKYFFS